METWKVPVTGVPLLVTVVEQRMLKYIDMPPTATTSSITYPPIDGPAGVRTGDDSTSGASPPSSL